jgi:hypothetical protein
MQIQIEYTLQDSGLNSTSLNNSIEIFLLSIDRLEKSRKINLLVSIVFLIIGLIGHLLTIFVFIQKRFRKNSCDVYILCLAINDLLFLIIHFFEDTIRTFKDIVFAVNNNLNDLKLLHSLNLIDNSILSCLSMNYLRYVLRFISAYIIVAFTIQRLLSIHSPFSQRFKSTKSAWLTIGVLTCCSFLINIWVLFYFEIQSDETYNNNVKSCEVKNEKKEWIREYFHITLAYIFIIILIPIIVIFVSNSIIIINIFQSCPKRNGLKMHKSTFNIKKKKKKTEITSSGGGSSSTNNDNKVKLRPYYLTIDQIINRVTNKANKSKKITKMLILISFSYAFLNLPYLVAWSFYYYGSIFHNDDVVENNYLYAALKIAEIFYLLNYSIYFYIYYLSGSLFRNQLKYSSKYLFNVCFYILF